MASTAPMRFDEISAANVRLIGIPTRVSTTKQAENDEGSLKTQLQRTRAYIDYMNISGGSWREVETYRLPGISGKHSLQHPEFLRMQQDIRMGRINTVLATELSRVSRNVAEFLQFVELLNVHRCEFICLKQKVDTTDAMGRLILTFLVALAQFERETTGERTKDAMAARAERGLWNGGSLYGYSGDPHRKGYLSVIDMEADVVRFAFVTYLACGSIAHTVQALNDAGYRTRAYVSRNKIEHPAEPFQVSGVEFMLQNHAYIGEKELDKMRNKKLPREERRFVPAVWEPIVEQETFDAVGDLMEQNHRARMNVSKEVQHAFVLNSGLLSCGACGSLMAGRTGTGRLGKTYFYYACTNKTCGIRIVATEIEGAILERLAVLAGAPDVVDGLVAATNTALQRQLPALGKRRRSLMREHADVKGQADRLFTQLADFADGDAKAMISAKLTELAERKRQLEDAIFEVDRDISRVQAGRIGPETVRQALGQITEIYQHLKPHERKELVRLILQKAEVHPREISLSLYGEALSTMAEGPNLAVSSSKRSRSPIRLPALVSQSVVRFESSVRVRSLTRHLQWKKRQSAALDPAPSALPQRRCPMPPGTPCPKYGSIPTAAPCR